MISTFRGRPVSLFITEGLDGSPCGFGGYHSRGAWEKVTNVNWEATTGSHGLGSGAGLLHGTVGAGRGTLTHVAADKEDSTAAFGCNVKDHVAPHFDISSESLCEFEKNEHDRIRAPE